MTETAYAVVMVLVVSAAAYITMSIACAAAAWLLDCLLDWLAWWLG